MNIDSIYTRKTFGLDNMVWRLMISLIILSVGLLSYKLAGREKCTPFSFEIKSITLDKDSAVYTNEAVSFSANTTQNIQWDFNDKTNRQQGQYVTHRFVKEGKYYVTASVNSQCQAIKVVTVKKPKVDTIILPENTDAGERILGHSSTFTATLETYVCSAVGTVYEWAIENNPTLKPQAIGPTAKIEFPNPGKYRIQVTVDSNRDKRYFKEIIVEKVIKPKPKPGEELNPQILLPGQIPQKEITTPEPPPPVKPREDSVKARSHTTTPVSNRAFTIFLEEFKNKKMAATDFDVYLCGKGSTPVILNGNKRDVIDFSSFLAKLTKRRGLAKLRRPIEVEKVVLNHDADDRCVTTIEIETR